MRVYKYQLIEIRSGALYTRMRTGSAKTADRVTTIGVQNIISDWHHDKLIMSTFAEQVSVQTTNKSKQNELCPLVV